MSMLPLLLLALALAIALGSAQRTGPTRELDGDRNPFAFGDPGQGDAILTTLRTMDPKDLAVTVAWWRRTARHLDDPHMARYAGRGLALLARYRKHQQARRASL